MEVTALRKEVLGLRNFAVEVVGRRTLEASNPNPISVVPELGEALRAASDTDRSCERRSLNSRRLREEMFGFVYAYDAAAAPARMEIGIGNG